MTKFITFICENCGKSVNNMFNKHEFNRRKNHCCSKECYKTLRKNNRKGENRTCVNCGKTFFVIASEIRRGGGKYCSRECSPFLKKERKMSTDGYWIIHTPEGEIKEQRYLMQQLIGRKLKSSEIVHHINFDKLDNRIENLKIVTRSEHNTLHHSGNHYRHDFSLR